MIDCDDKPNYYDRYGYYPGIHKDELRFIREEQKLCVSKVINDAGKPLTYEELLEVPNKLGINKYRFAAMVRHVMNNQWPNSLQYLR